MPLTAAGFVKVGLSSFTYLKSKQVKMWPKADMALHLLTPISPRLDKLKTKNSDVTRVQREYVPSAETVRLTEILELHSAG